MNCFYCGKKKQGSNTMFYKLDQNGHEICQSCMSEGHWKSALEIIEHNKQTEYIRGQRMKVSLYEDDFMVPREIIDEICKPFIKNKE